MRFPLSQARVTSARRLLEALWGREPLRSRGPSPRHSVAEIVRAAVAIADDAGIAGVSMREVARKVGCSPMALYGHVETRDDLLALMVDHTLAKLRPPGPGAWRERVEALARAERSLYVAHPWMLDVDSLRSGLGPGELALGEHFVAATSESGLDVGDAGLLWLTITSFVRGSARAAVEARRVARASALRDADWWATAWAAFADVAGDLAQRYPALARVKAAGGFDGDDPDDAGYLEVEARRTFEFGLQRILDGVEALTQARAT